ncbi:hypothetical protein CFC21_081262 [Triticum aestivum]|uniref:Leucine-rich repeat-containing N-terminal plant-type domain-containing protein n=2 Tax=Triticum aestivum TaxID=4565 RepID=A0A9R1L3S2_WHEAT|nr:hypothetical protein CFC21_081262 [Triticum aestivum]
MAKCCLLLLLFLGFLLPEAHAALCHPDDLRALQDSVGNLRAGGVLIHAMWFGGTCCSWEGVGCDAASEKQTGPIPGTSLVGLARLEELDLGSNGFHNISGVLTILRGCQNLTMLILTKNFGGEELPDGGAGFRNGCLNARKWRCLICPATNWWAPSHRGLVSFTTFATWISQTISLVGDAPKSLAPLKGFATGGCSLGMVFSNMPSYVKHNRSTLGRRLSELPNVITGTNNFVTLGSNNVVSGNANDVIYGDENTVSGNNHAVYGNENIVSGNNHVVSGSKHVVSGSRHGVTGRGSVVSGRVQEWRIWNQPCRIW